MIPETFTSEGASDRALTMLNGQSSGSAKKFTPSKDDYILGVVREVGSYIEKLSGRAITRISLLVEEGTEEGIPIQHHAHRVITGQHIALHKLLDKLDPHEGDTLALAYFGRDDTKRPARHLWRGSVERGEGRVDVNRDF